MRRNNSYILTEIAGVPYLLPFGQMIADHKPGIRLNETGICLWKLLEQEHSMEELVRQCAEFYDVTDSGELQQLSADITEFTETLCSCGILEDTSHLSHSSSCVKYLNIGGLITRLEGPAEAFCDRFNKFCIPSCHKVHQTVHVHIIPPAVRQNGTVLLRNEELVVMENPNAYILLFPAARRIIEASLSKNGKTVDFYCLPPYTDTFTFRDDLFHAIRLVWLYLAQQHNMMAIHSASILYRDKAWLFAGPSGTGKSTHTNLWHELFNTPILNGDLNLLSIENHQAVIHGLPWCGTSEISNSGTYPLGGIILLKQAGEDSVEELSNDQQTLSILNRFISPAWDKHMLEQNLTFAANLAGKIIICRLKCTRESTAAQIMRQYIDDYITTCSNH